MKHRVQHVWCTYRTYTDYSECIFSRSLGISSSCLCNKCRTMTCQLCYKKQQKQVSSCDHDQTRYENTTINDNHHNGLLT